MLQEIPISYCYLLSAAVFAIGAVGAITRKNSIVIFMSIELMLNAVNLVFISSGNAFSSMDGSIFVFFVMTVAAVEAAVGLAIFMMLFRIKGTINADEASLMKG
jgi:NADH-quinone oxidoreductase subunit K